MAVEKIKTIFRNFGYIAAVVGILAGVVLVKQNQDLREKAAPATSLFISPASLSVGRGSDFTAYVMMNTGTNNVTGLDIDLSFNPSVFEVTTITKGAGIGNLTQEVEGRKVIDNATGKITYSAFTIDKTKAVKGTAIQVLVLSVKSKATAPTGSSSFNFLNSSAVAATSEGQNVLVGTTPSVITIKKPGDINGDGNVNMVDIGIIVDNYGLSTPNDPRADISGDGKVNIVDIGVVVDNYAT